MNSLPDDRLPIELANSKDYHEIRELGRGGMGVVYLAKNRLMDRLEVLKVVSPSLVKSEVDRARFLREIRAVAMLRHPNVVMAYNAQELGSLLILSMEYVNGEDLHQLVARTGPQSIRRCATFGCQIALGLQHAHETGMVHRDIKPNNVLCTTLNKKIYVKVADFGLAKFSRESTTRTDLTGTESSLGTPNYMAPEQARDASKADIRADLYSLGATLYYLLTGRPPFVGSSYNDLIIQLISESCPPIASLRPDIPPTLAAVVHKLLAKEPSERYQTPAEVARALLPFSKQTEPDRTEPAILDSLAPRNAVPIAKRKKQSSVMARVIPVLRRATPSAQSANETPSAHATPRFGEPIIDLTPAKARVGYWVAFYATIVLIVALITGFILTYRPTNKQPNANTKPTPGEKLTLDLGDGVSMDFVYCPPGTFLMGSDPKVDTDHYLDELQHEVVLSNGFFIGRDEVTQAQWQTLMGSNPSSFVGERNPVDSVTWKLAIDFCEKVQAKTGKPIRLPTEAEWEYAARGGTTTPFYWGTELNGTQANCDGNHPCGTGTIGPYFQGTKPVGSYTTGFPHPWGLNDVSGNVAEWCQDVYDPKFYQTTPQVDPLNLVSTNSKSHVIRGGHWYSLARKTRVSFRDTRTTDESSNQTGLRVCFTPNE